ncbi:MAG: ATP/GTP-binding protein [Candidatus Brockarchaeota archaeon]|nr:ATP/GTP-binding protein [Candidatus Brockarchaeota archaeon]
MKAVFLIGTAGSGKTTFVKNFSQWMEDKGVDVARINLDPGVISLPYPADFDVRTYVDTEKLMRDIGLGPNSALTVASDLIAVKVHEISEEIEAMGHELALIDTPGQIELFAFRPVGRAFSERFLKGPRMVIYLFDYVLMLEPLSFLASLYLSISVYASLTMPQLNVINKVDLVEPRVVRRIEEWYSNPLKLYEAITKSYRGEKLKLGQELSRALSLLSSLNKPMPVSAVTMEGFVDVYSQVTRILGTGEEFSQEQAF